jgi:hypothetical protein
MPRSKKLVADNGNGNVPVETKAKPEASPVSCQLTKDDYEVFRARIKELGTGFTNQSVLLGLIKLWLDGKVDLPTPPERLKADAHSALAKLLDVDLSKAEEITRTLNSLSEPAQVIKQ